MPDLYLIRYTPTAADELKEIFDYIERDSAWNAAGMMERIVRAIESLDTLPHRYRVARNIKYAGRPVRSMPVTPYLVRYQIDEPTLAVLIVSVRHGARKPGL
jgi:toxin ParE1/3/4